MNPPDRPNSHTSSEWPGVARDVASPRAAEEKERPARVHPVRPPSRLPSGLSFAFQVAQENLAALQRLAEQTADLHRQFLEGQEKTQQTFLKLLEQQQRIWTSQRPRHGGRARRPVAGSVDR